MSVTGALSTGAPAFAQAARVAVRPFWLRPAALVLILSVHGLMFLSIASRPTALSPVDSVEVALVPLGDAAEDQKKQDEIAPAAPEPAPPPQAESVAPVEPASAPPPLVAAPEAVPLPVEQPKPAPPPKEVVEKKPPEKAAADRRLEKTPEKRQDARREREIAERRKAQQGRQELKRGAADGEARASSMSPASYASLLAAEIRRHIFYPAAARAAGATGVVGVAFTVGPAGRVVSQSIVRSSGDPVLDSAARTTLYAIHMPPPPGGRFSTSTNIRFHFN